MPFAEAGPQHPQTLGQQDRQGALESRLAGAVAVVGDHDLVGVARQQPGLLLGEGGAHARDRPRPPAGDGGDDVEIALDQHRAALLADLLAGLVQAIEEMPLVEALGLDGVDVLGLVVAQGAAAETDQPPRGVVDGEHEPVAKPVVEPAPVLLRAADQARRLEIGERHPRRQGIGQSLPAVGGVAEAVALHELGRHAPAGEVALGRGGLAQLVGEEARRRGQRSFEIPLGRAAGTDGARRQRDGVALGERLDGRRKVVAGRQHVQLDGVAADAAAEAVEQPPHRVDAERRRLFLVQRAESLVAAAGLAQAGVVGGDGHDVHGIAHRLDQLRGEADVA